MHNDDPFVKKAKMKILILTYLINAPSHLQIKELLNFQGSIVLPGDKIQSIAKLWKHF